MKYLTAILIALIVLAAVFLSGDSEHNGDGHSLRWATSASGSAGHRTMLGLAGMLNRHWDDHDIDVLPTAGAVASLRGYGAGHYDGFYGADISLHEVAADRGRLTGYTQNSQRPPLQTLWVYSMEVGLAVAASQSDSYPDWQAFDGATLFTGPAAWDVRARLDMQLAALGIEYRYREVDLGLAASNLARGSLDAMVVYTAGERQPPAWLQEAQMATDLVVVNPSADEHHRLQAAGLGMTQLPASLLRGGSDDDTILMAPFLYGFHLSHEVSGEAVFRMLELIEQHADELAASDPVFAQLASDMPGLQQRGIDSTGEAAAIHPGLAQYLRSRNAWSPDWDDRIAKPD